jgi:hypothetical protein
MAARFARAGSTADYTLIEQQPSLEALPAVVSPGPKKMRTMARANLLRRSTFSTPPTAPGDTQLVEPGLRRSVYSGAQDGWEP